MSMLTDTRFCRYPGAEGAKEHEYYCGQDRRRNAQEVQISSSCHTNCRNHPDGSRRRQPMYYPFRLNDSVCAQKTYPRDDLGCNQGGILGIAGEREMP